MYEWIRDLPSTERIYYYDSYQRRITAKVLRVVKDRGRRAYVVLDKTIFHPLGGGQPSDTGYIKYGETLFRVKKVLSKGGVILHYGVFNNKEDMFAENDKVSCEIDWDRRYLTMKLHTGGHILDYAVARFFGKLVETLSALHGPPKAYLDYKIPSPPDIGRVEKYVQEVIDNDLPVNIFFVSPEELDKYLYNAPNIDRIPHAKVYRIISIPGVNSMPCTGTHVRRTSEVRRLKIKEVDSVGDGWRIYYWVE